MVLQYGESDVRHWASTWLEQGIPPEWIRGHLVYHEVIGIQGPAQRIELWDPSDAEWLVQLGSDELGRVIAVRVLAESDSALYWGNVSLAPGEWVVVHDPTC